MAKFPRGGNTRFPSDSHMRRAHLSPAAGFLYGQLAVLRAATRPGALKRFLGETAWAEGTPETRWLRVLERLVLAGGAIDLVLISDASDEKADRVLAHVISAHMRAQVSAELLVWMLCCLADAQETIHRRLVDKPIEWSAWWVDWRSLGERLGIPGLPRTYGAYRFYMARQDAPAISDEDSRLALDCCLYLPGFPVPRRYRLLMPLVRLTTVALLPEEVRAAYRLRHGPWRRVVARAVFAFSRLAHRVVPRRSPGMVDFAGLAATAKRLREEIEARQ